MRSTTLAALGLLTAISTSAFAQATKELAPNGTLRVGILLSNPILVTKTLDGKRAGISIDLGRLVAAKVGARYSEVRYRDNESFSKSLGSKEWDVAIIPSTPSAENDAALSSAFMLVDNIYLVAPGRDIRHASEVDRPNMRIAVGTDSAPDQYLSKTLKNATLVRVQGPAAEIIEVLRGGKADVYGSNAENVQAAAEALPGSYILPGAFRTVSMVIAYPKEASLGTKHTIEAVIAEAKSSGLIQRAIDEGRLKGVRVAD